MKKRALLFLSMIFLGFSSVAQENYSEILDEFQKNRVSFKYQYVIPGLEDIVVNGSAVIQKECFRMEGTGLLVLCDGVNVWTLDVESKEAYVEYAGGVDFLDFVTSLAWEGDNLVGSFVEPNSESIITFTLYDIEKAPVSGDLSIFMPAEDSFIGDWIITDLR